MTKFVKSLSFFANLSLILGMTLSTSSFAQARVDILEAGVLNPLDQPGRFSLATVLGVGDVEANLVSKNGLQQIDLLHLSTSSTARYNEIAQQVTRDIKDIIKTSGEKMAYSSEIAETMAKDGKVPRYFDYFWLNSSEAAFPLVAVINRLDKRDFYADTCGEVRFIYRLAYRREKPVVSMSSMPIFLNVVFDYLPDASGSCQAIAAQWTGLPSSKDSEALIAQLSHGALNKNSMRFKQVELNMQAVRYPSELKFDFGGQAIYLFRIFKEVDGRFQSIPLENTINVGAIKNSESLKKALLAQLSDPRNLEKIDDGTFILENSEGKLLSTRALSFTTLGRARTANKPFTSLFGVEAKELQGLNLSNLKFVRTPRGLVERLNGLTCIGCHQTGGTAGFHMLGRVNPFNNSFNQVLLPFSPHYGGERLRRQKYTADLAQGLPISTFRPPSFFPPLKSIDAQGLPVFQEAKVRELCLKPDQVSYSRGIVCEKGTHCLGTAQNKDASITIGECVADKNDVPGYVCRQGVMSSQPIRPELGEFYNLFAIRDTLNFDTLIGAAGSRCTKPDQGVPLGRIPLRCMPDTADGRLEFVDRMTDASQAPKSMCVVQGGQAFDDCAKSSNPPACLETAEIARAFLDTCSNTRFCREDYICQQLPDVSRQYRGQEKVAVEQRVKKLAELGVGFCVPNYFIFSMRADGHILPEGRVQAGR